MNSTVPKFGPPFSAQQVLSLHALNFTFSGTSMLGSLLIVVSFIIFPSLRKFYHKIIFFMSLADIVSSATVFVVMGIALGKGALLKDGPWCSLIGFTLTMSVVSVDFYILVATLHVYEKTSNVSNVTTLSRKTFVETHQKRVFLAIQLFSFLTALSPLIFPGFGYHALNGGVYCFIDEPKWTRYLIGTGPRYIIMLIIVVLYSKLYLTKRKELLKRQQNRLEEMEQGNTFSLSSSDKSVDKSASKSDTEKRSLKSQSDIPSNDSTISLKEKEAKEKQQEKKDKSFEKLSKMEKKLEKERKKKLKQEDQASLILLNMMIFVPVIYFCCWLLPTINAIYETLPGAKTSFVLSALFRITWPWQGFWNALLWSYVERLPMRFQEKFWPQGFKQKVKVCIRAKSNATVYDESNIKTSHLQV